VTLDGVHSPEFDTGLDIYFCDPHNQCRRGVDGNTNGLLRQSFPKGTDLSQHSREDLTEGAVALNGRPRKTLDWKTLAEEMNHQLLSARLTVCVASTP
jgi:IS30 family transposase